MGRKQAPEDMVGALLFLHAANAVQVGMVSVSVEGDVLEVAYTTMRA